MATTKPEPGVSLDYLISHMESEIEQWSYVVGDRQMVQLFRAGELPRQQAILASLQRLQRAESIARELENDPNLWHREEIHQTMSYESRQLERLCDAVLKDQP